MRIAAVQHDIVWNDRAANFARLAPMIAWRDRRRGRAGAADRDVLHRVQRRQRRVRRGRGRPVVGLPRRAGRLHRPWVCGTCPEVPPDAATTAARTTASCSPGRTAPAPLPQDPPVHLRRRGQARPPRRRTDHGGDRWPAGIAVRLLRPALRRRVLAAAPRRPTSTSSRRTGPPHAGCTGRPCCRHGPSRTRPTSSGCNRVGTGGGLDYCGDSRIVDPTGELLATASQGETILLADVTADHVVDVRTRFRFMQDRR